jgi:hypothetical protein
MATPLVDFERHKHKVNDRTNAEDSGNLESCSGNARKLWRTDLVSMGVQIQPDWLKQLMTRFTTQNNNKYTYIPIHIATYSVDIMQISKVCSLIRYILSRGY